MSQESANIRQRSDSRTNEPRKYLVLIHNDDFTPMDFVVEILVTIFRKPEPEAVSLMLSVHHSDRAVAGVYSYDIARSKADKAMRLAREEGYPLRLTCEPE